MEKGKASNFYYYESFAEFLASHYLPIKGIDESTVKEYLSQDNSGFGYQLLKGLRDTQEQLIAVVTDANPMFIVDIDSDKIVLSEILAIKEFYVYPFQKGEIITASGIALSHIDVQVDFGFRSTRNKLPATIRPIVEVKFNLPYVDGLPGNIHFETITIQNNSELKLPFDSDTVSRMERLTARVAKLNSLYSISSPIEVAKKIIDSLYEKSEPVELWTIDDLDWESPALRRSGFNRSTSKYIPITAKSPSFKDTKSTNKKGRNRKA